MSMSTHVVGYKPPDERWRAMKAVYDACVQAGIPVPKEVEGDFFGWEPPRENGVEVPLEDTPCCRRVEESDTEGFEVEVRLLPPDVTLIRFTNSY